MMIVRDVEAYSRAKTSYLRGAREPRLPRGFLRPTLLLLPLLIGWKAGGKLCIVCLVVRKMRVEVVKEI
jgi:hypothetical protein